MTKKTQQSASVAALDRLLPMPTVIDVTSLSKATVYRKIEDGSFPRPIKISKARVAWRQSDVANWLGRQPSTGQ